MIYIRASSAEAGTFLYSTLETTAPVTDFQALGLDPGLLDGLQAMGIRTPTPIQAQAIPAVMDGRDLIACAQTGTGKTADQLAMQTAAQMAEQLKADIRTGVRVSAIDPAAKTVTVDGEVLPFGQLVLALGADAFQPPMGGDGLDRVLNVNDLMDYARFQAAAEGKKDVIVIGGGLIGSEYANDLSNGGYAVQLVEPVGRVLPALLPPVASEAVGAALAGLGVRVCGDLVK